MTIRNYDEINMQELDVIREMASIGTGSAATALSGLLNEKIGMTIPETRILDYEQIIKALGEPEEGVAAVLSQMSGDMNGIVMLMMKMDFINALLEKMVGKTVTSYECLDELDISAITEVGNIIISSYTTALSGLVNMEIELSVPSISVNMLGGIISVPIAEFGYETDHLLLTSGMLKVDEKLLDSTVLMMPDIPSLQHLMEKVGVTYD